jgi:hypothetical protein
LDEKEIVNYNQYLNYLGIWYIINMKKISFLKKVKLFFFFRKNLNRLKNQLETSFNARVDRASRIYTIINIPSSLIEEPYNLRKEDIDSLAKNYLSDYTRDLSNFLNSNNLMELYDFYEVKKVAKYSYLVIFGFSLFNSVNFLLGYYITLYSSLVLIISLLIFTLKLF